ncbi:acyltransferase family protein [Burkholderia sp. Ac-20379]|uniref:acyltransferase family protein n=1 Tax=Burkholderia sp. Ac-20379 TaxID=2703900 RepID=UPI0030DCD457
MASTSRSTGIDLLRGIAILTVLLLHFHLTYRLDVTPFDAPWLSAAIRAVARNGNYGVTMFFVVSGYLITATALRRFGSLGAVRPLAFYRTRAARIAPCLLLALAIMTALGALGLHAFTNKPNTASMPLAVLSVLTFWHNVLMAKLGYFNYAMNILWSLSVEEVFYLAFPLLCVALRRRRFVLPLLGALMLAGPAWRWLHADDEIVALYGYLSCFDAIAIGCGVALLPARALSARAFRRLAWGVALAMAATWLSGPIMREVVWGVSVIALGTGALLYGMANRTERAGALASGIYGGEHGGVSNFIRFFGVRSYELYLFHIVVLGVLRETLTRANIVAAWKPVWLLLYVAVASVVAQLVFRQFSEPLNARLRGARGALPKQDD